MFTILFSKLLTELFIKLCIAATNAAARGGGGLPTGGTVGVCHLLSGKKGGAPAPPLK